MVCVFRHGFSYIPVCAHRVGGTSPDTLDRVCRVACVVCRPNDPSQDAGVVPTFGFADTVMRKCAQDPADRRGEVEL